MVQHTINLPDGRQLGYALYGTAGGWPVLYFHGTPSSRLELKILGGYKIDIEKLLDSSRQQLISVDRPGMGLSSLHPNRSFISFSDDVFVLLQHLNIQHCSLLCWSGGGPYALAMAWRHPAVISNVFIICGFSRPFTGEIVRKMGRNKWYFLTARYTPWLLETIMNMVSRSNGRYYLPQWVSGLPDADYELIREPAYLHLIGLLTLKEACRNGARGPVEDARLYFKDYGFHLSDISQVVHFWWGTQDNAVIREHAENVGHQIKNNVLHFKKD